MAIFAIPRWAKAGAQTRFVLALDESGQRHIRPSDRRHGFIVGGILLPEPKLPDLACGWREVRKELFDDTIQDPKGFDVVRAMPRIGDAGSPEVALAALSARLSQWGSLPVGAFLDKDDAGPGVAAQTRKGGTRIDQWSLFELVVRAFGEFLRRKKARGIVRLDKLSGVTEEKAWQANWAELRREDGAPLTRVDERLDFCDSAVTEEIQVAGAIAGVLLEHFEKRLPVLDGMENLLRESERETLLFNIQS